MPSQGNCMPSQGNVHSVRAVFFKSMARKLQVVCFVLRGRGSGKTDTELGPFTKVNQKMSVFGFEMDFFFWFNTMGL